MFIDIEYPRGRKRIKRPRAVLARLPIMLGSNMCVFGGKFEAQITTMSECPLDPGVISSSKARRRSFLVQEQLSKNRILVKTDGLKKIVSASVSS